MTDISAPATQHTAAPPRRVPQAAERSRFLAPWRTWAAIWSISFVAIWAVGLGVEFALAALIVVTIHELGHWVGAWSVGVPAQIAVAPAMGLTVFEREPDRRIDAVVVFVAGPAANLLTALACVPLGDQHRLAMLVGRISVIVGIANLVPVPVLDGGRIVHAITAGSGAARAMATTMATVAGTWFAAALCLLIRSDDLSTCITLALIAVGSAFLHWDDWKTARECAGTRIFGRWVTTGVIAGTAAALIAEHWLANLSR